MSHSTVSTSRLPSFPLLRAEDLDAAVRDFVDAADADADADAGAADASADVVDAAGEADFDLEANLPLAFLTNFLPVGVA